ncbi:MAG TPA: DinB family protein [Paracoccaceae bacterium]|nr:DinB family protein [Paracoccaceae bacterium]
MISPDHVRTMAAYNAWQNRSLYGAAAKLDDAARRLDRGAFFRSIHGTLAHLLWADRLWLHRLTGLPKPNRGSIAESVNEEEEWEALAAARRACDGTIADWAGAITPEVLADSLSWYSGSISRQITKTVWVIVTHLFNHQTHHRGQVHAMLTAAGVRPEATDLILLPD